MRTIRNLILSNYLSLLLTPALAQQAPTPPKAEPTKAQIAQASLFPAIIFKDLAGIKEALDAGANPNEPDFIDMPPLGFVQDVPTAELLLSRGAKLDQVTTKGSPLSLALLAGNDKLALYLLAKGAKEATRFDGITGLMGAAYSGATQSLDRMITDRSVGAKLEQQDKEGATALTFAVRGNQLQSAKRLIEAGASVNTADGLKRTPLHYAALYHQPQMVSLLLSHGASIKAKDATGATPLHLAAHYSGDAETIRTLLAGGAPRDAKDDNGKTALELAARRNYSQAIKLLKPGSATASTPLPSTDLLTAVRPSLVQIQKSMRRFQEQAMCASCHHQGLGMIALNMAKKQNLPVDKDLFEGYLKGLEGDSKFFGPSIHGAVHDPKLTNLVPVVHLGDFNITSAYLMAAQVGAGVRPTPELQNNAALLTRFQSPEGCWNSTNRGIMQKSSAVNTALILTALSTYSPSEAKTSVQSCMEKAKSWATSQKSKSPEDQAACLEILKQTGADTRSLIDAAKPLLATQRPDGGWGEPGSANSDPYTTGVVVHALRSIAQIPASDARLKRAVIFLLRNQDADGSWFMPKMVPALNNHFDSGFPHGFDQYASFAGTCWATIALLDMRN